ncbi:hypothetical protein TNCV_3774311 [Trichonephila clavipes]|nr:hypothetical protein TNCV_3774311 [Trichonephila clavipes]
MLRLLLLEPQLLDIMIVQFRNEKASNQDSIPITIDCNVVALIVFEEGFHQPIKRTKQYLISFLHPVLPSPKNRCQRSLSMSEYADELKLVVPDNAKVLDLRELIQESEIYKNDKERYQAIVDCVLEEINDRRNEDENRRNENENRLEIEKLNCHS